MNNELSLQQAVDLFLSDKKASTAKSYYWPLKRLMDQIGPARAVVSLKPRHMIEYTHTLPDAWATATFNKHIKTIKVFFNWLVAIEELDRNPAKTIKMINDRHRVHPDKAITDDQLADLISYCKWHASSPRDLALVMVCADVGPRAGEMSALMWQNIDLDKLEVHIPSGKTGEGIGAIGTETAKTLRHWREHIEVKKGRLPLSTEYVWSVRGSGPLQSQSISQTISRLCDAAGVRQEERYKKHPCGVHMFRHRKGFQLAERRVSPATAAEVMRHDDPVTTLQNYYPRAWWAAEPVARSLTWGADQQDKVISFDEKYA